MFQNTPRSATKDLITQLTTRPCIVFAARANKINGKDRLSPHAGGAQGAVCEGSGPQQGSRCWGVEGGGHTKPFDNILPTSPQATPFLNRWLTARASLPTPIGCYRRPTHTAVPAHQSGERERERAAWRGEETQRTSTRGCAPMMAPHLYSGCVLTMIRSTTRDRSRISLSWTR